MRNGKISSVLLGVILSVALAGGAGAGVALAWPAQAAGAGGVARARPATPARPGLIMIAPTAVRDRPRSPAVTGRAVKTCAYYAAKAGWPDNGYYGGGLVTAAAICVAESAGNPNLIVCDNQAGNVTGQGNYPKFTCPKGTVSYDRGLWQLNTAAAKGTSSNCAFSPACNAGQAYLYSGRGTSFAPWSSYDTDEYAGPFIDLVQGAVLTLGRGTVTSALLGECLAAVRPEAGAKVAVENCGSGAASQQWSFAGAKLKSGSLCAAIASRSARSPGIVLERCARSRAQDWSVAGRYELRNSYGKCLTDPGPTSLRAGNQVDAAGCRSAKNQTWWLS